MTNTLIDRIAGEAQREHIRHTKLGRSQQHGPSPCHNVSHRTSVITYNVGFHADNGSNSVDRVFGRSSAGSQP
jgi:hypothetical protein